MNQLISEAGLSQFLFGSEFATQGDTAQAETAFANAVRLAPHFSLARYQLGLLQFSSGRAALALLTWEPLFDLPESDPLPHFINGFAALAQDRFDEALGHYVRGLQQNTSNPAVSGDIEMVMTRIRALMAAQADEETGNRPADEASGSHVLLTNYQRSSSDN